MGFEISNRSGYLPSVVKEIIIGSVLALAAGSLWKMHHWNEQRKVRVFYELLEQGEISVVAEEKIDLVSIIIYGHILCQKSNTGMDIKSLILLLLVLKCWGILLGRRM